MLDFAKALVDSFAAQVEAPRNQKRFSDATVGGVGAQRGRASAGNRRWQEQVWAYYDEIGELHYVMSFLGACLSRCRLTIGIADERGIVGPVFDEDGSVLDDDGVARPELDRAPEALALVQSLQNEIGGQSELLRRMGQNLTGPGEFHLVGSRKEDDTRQADSIPVTDLKWEVLSTDEFRPKGLDFERRMGPGTQPQTLKAADLHAIRIWKSHPRYTFEPDSSIRAVLDVLEELVLLTREVRSQTMSRLSNAGLLLVPDEIQWGDEESDETDDGDAFARDMIETFKRPIQDKNSPAAFVPFVVRAPAEYLKPEYFRHIDLSPQNPSDSAEKRKEAIQRFAQGIDLPVEIVLGHADTKFANAVVIDDNLFKTHVEPVLDLIADALTVGFLRPSLDDPESQLVVWYDSGELVARPNRAADAKDLHKAGVLSDASLRAAAGFSENDAPDEDEIEARTARQQRTTPGRKDDEPKSPNDDPDKAKDGPGDDEPGSDVEQGKDKDKAATTSIALSAMSELAVDRAIERAGARLRSKADAFSSSLRSQLAQVPDAEVAVTLGPTMVERLLKGGSPFGKEFGVLQRLTVQWTGSPEFAERLSTSCDAVAQDRLYRPRDPFPHDALPVYDVPVDRELALR